MYKREKPPKRGPSLHDLSGGSNYELYNKLMEAGFGQDFLDRMRHDPRFARIMFEVYESGGITNLPEPERELDRIFGRSGYFGLRDWGRYLWVRLGEHALSHFPQFPWPYDIFDQPCKFHAGKTVGETHAVFLGLFGDDGTWGQFHLDGLAHLIKARGPALLDEFGNSLSMEVRLRQEARVKMPSPKSFRWYMMLIGAVPNTDDMLYTQQMKHLPEEYELPTACEIVLSKTCFYTKVGRLYQPGDSKWTRASDMACDKPTDLGICVGQEYPQKIAVMARENLVNYHEDRIAIYASRIPGR